MGSLNEISIYDKTYNTGYKGYIVLNDDFWYEGFIFQNLNNYKTYKLTFGFYMPNGIKQMIIIPTYDEFTVPEVIRNNECTNFKNCAYMIGVHGEIRTNLELVISSLNIDVNSDSLKNEVLGIVERLKSINPYKELYENILCIRKINSDLLIHQSVNCSCFESGELNEIFARSAKSKQKYLEKLERDFYDTYFDDYYIES